MSGLNSLYNLTASVPSEPVAVTVTLPEDSRIVLSASVTSVSSSTIIIFIVYLHSCYFLYSMKIFWNRYKNAKSVISINFYSAL